MPSLRDYLIGRIEAAGYQVADIELITWDTRTEYADGTTWVPTNAASFSQSAQRVDIGDVGTDARTRIRFHMRTGAVYQWIGDDFVRVDDVPRSIEVTPAMLRGE